MRWAAIVTLMLVGLTAGCKAYNSHNPYPSKESPGEGSGFPITKMFINNAVLRDSPNLQ